MYNTLDELYRNMPIDVEWKNGSCNVILVLGMNRLEVETDQQGFVNATSNGPEYFISDLTYYAYEQFNPNEGRSEIYGQPAKLKEELHAFLGKHHVKEVEDILFR